MNKIFFFELMLQILSSKTYKDIVKIHTTKRNNIKFENS